LERAYKDVLFRHPRIKCGAGSKDGNAANNAAVLRAK
jgi:hypothetical protein